ncbi:hypothetical protein BWR18_09935 [Tateyamaria omphalii]|uniref:Uncharacterized protein n=2 Tax=Tateyamaria omphalii TaxID=299262 RepID=A0A1P8MVJ4_9RHOB|nr:hypothetical protein BWR18_09935 [Tateyamaria omphalii]
MTNTEVEDVLASIRRLVSDDNRPEPENEAPTRTDRLVLTPALRVMEEVADEQAEPDAELQPDLDDDDVFQTEYDASDAPPEAEVLQAPWEDHPAEDAQDDADDVTPTQPEGGETSITLDTVDLEQDTLMSIQDAFADVGVEEDEVSEPAKISAGTAPTPLSDKIAALETLIAGQTEEFEPDMAGDGENAGTEPPTLEWEDAGDVAEAAETHEADAEPVGNHIDETQIFSTDEDVLDEDALRDLVSDIVREELQGALGERITRNVRKLVRREIHRALAAQDLE